MSFSIKNTVSQFSKTQPLYSESSYISTTNLKDTQTFEEKIPISKFESVLKFDVATNSWIWREMGDTSISTGPSGNLSNICDKDLKVVVNLPDTVDIQTKKVEMSKPEKNKQTYKKRQKKKK